MAVEGHTLGWREISIGVNDQQAREQLRDRFGTLWDEFIDVDGRIVETLSSALESEAKI